MTDGEVAVRQNGQEHAVAAPALDGQIIADLDGEQPVIEVPTEVGVVYTADGPEDLATDGYGHRTEVEMRGFALPEGSGKAALLVGGGSLVAAGALFGNSMGTGGLPVLAALLAGVMLTYIGARTAWSDRTTGSDRNRPHEA